MNRVRLDGFSGMNNIRHPDQTEPGRGTQLTEHLRSPRIILDADVSARGHMVRRQGYRKLVDLEAAHSLWSGAGAMLYVAGTTLYRYVSGDTEAIATVDGPEYTPLAYQDYDNLIYMSNQYWHGVYDPIANRIDQWGVDLPPRPELGPPDSGEYGLPPGKYFILYTQGTEENPSGPSEFAESNGGIITLTNRPPGAVVWCTDPASGIFYRIGEVDSIVKIEASEPYSGMFCGRPPFFTTLCFAFSRMWGASGKRLYYSEPFFPGLYNLKFGYFEYESKPVLIAKVRTGLFVGCENRTYFHPGTDPVKMGTMDVGSGALPGTLQYCHDVGDLADTISPQEKTHTDVPVWVSRESGIVAGNSAGRLFTLSSSKVRFATGRRGAALYRKRLGEFQYLFSTKAGLGSGFGLSDAVTVEVFRAGKLIEQ